MKKIAYVVILAGIALLVFPFAREYLHDKEQRQLLNEIEFAVATAQNAEKTETAETEYERLAHLFNGEDPVEKKKAPAASAESMNDSAIAVIEIDKIDLKLPVLEGATAANMKVGAAHLKETARLGEIGNAAIAAHRARTKGRQFNRLNEVEIGDRIDIRLRNGAVSYVVNEIKIVEPTDLSVLESKGDAAMLTLITCEPMGNPTHRLIVQAVKADDQA